MLLVMDDTTTNERSNDLTIICYHKGILAADRAMYSSSGVLAGHCNKLRVTKSGWVYGSAGPMNEISKFEDWADENWPTIGKTIKLKQMDALLASPQGGILMKYSEGSVYPLDPDFPSAIGCGIDFARGCLASGKNAIQTAMLVGENVNYCGGGVDFYVLTPDEGWVKGSAKAKKGG